MVSRNHPRVYCANGNSSTLPAGKNIQSLQEAKLYAQFEAAAARKKKIGTTVTRTLKRNWRLIKQIGLVSICLLVFDAGAIIIRHDVAPVNYEVNPDDYPFVFFLEQQGNSKVCVATVVHRQWAITAAHCAEETSLANTIDNGRKFAVTVDGRIRLIDLIIEHPQYDQDSSEDVDLALLRFSEESLSPAPVGLLSGPTEPDSNVTIMGWGYFGTGTTGRQYDNGQFRVAENRLSHVGHRYQITFDDPRAANSDVRALEGMPSLGDSGGPAFFRRAGALMLAGILVGEIEGVGFTEETQGKYGAVAVYERISEHIQWIETVVGSKLPFDS